LVDYRGIPPGAKAMYTIYGSELSYFTRKLEAAMIFYRAEFQRKPKPPEAEMRSGTHQVPVLLTPENWMIADTTPLLHLLDSRFPDRRLFPSGPLGVLVHVVEEYFDEWIARTMVHYRWHYEESAVFASQRMTAGNAEAAARIRNWGPRACRATGTDSEHQQQQCEAEYRRIMDALAAQLQQTRYALGDRPCAVDCILLGGIRAHTNMDPTPKRMMQDYPTIIAWADKGADAWDGDGELLPFPDSTPFARFVLTEMLSTYVPYALANGSALAAGAKAFHVDSYGEDVSYLTRPYPEQSRQMVGTKIATLLDESDQDLTRHWLAINKLDRCFG
jgi:glutathione S-transferase